MEKSMSPSRLAFEMGVEEGYKAEDIPALVALIRALYAKLEGPVQEPSREFCPDSVPVLS